MQAGLESLALSSSSLLDAQCPTLFALLGYGRLSLDPRSAGGSAASGSAVIRQPTGRPVGGVLSGRSDGMEERTRPFLTLAGSKGSPTDTSDISPDPPHLVFTNCFNPNRYVQEWPPLLLPRLPQPPPVVRRTEPSPSRSSYRRSPSHLGPVRSRFSLSRR